MKVKDAMSVHSMADVIPFLAYSLVSSNLTLRWNQKKIHFTHDKENNIGNIFDSFWQITSQAAWTSLRLWHTRVLRKMYINKKCIRSITPRTWQFCAQNDNSLNDLLIWVDYYWPLLSIHLAVLRSHSIFQLQMKSLFPRKNNFYFYLLYEEEKNIFPAKCH